MPVSLTYEEVLAQLGQGPVLAYRSQGYPSLERGLMRAPSAPR